MKDQSDGMNVLGTLEEFWTSTYTLNFRKVNSGEAKNIGMVWYMEMEGHSNSKIKSLYLEISNFKIFGIKIKIY